MKNEANFFGIEMNINPIIGWDYEDNPCLPDLSVKNIANFPACFQHRGQSDCPPAFFCVWSAFKLDTLLAF